MDDLNRIIAVIETAAESEGLPALAKRSGVPYTTLIDWQRAGWRPQAIVKFEKVAQAAATVAANDASPDAEAA